MPSGPQSTQKPRKSQFQALFWGPPHDEPFRATRQHSTTRGEAPFQRGGLAQIFRPGQTGRKAICQAVWPLPTGAGRGRGRPLLHETLLLGSRSALRTTGHVQTQKTAIWRPRPEDPLTISHFGPPDSIRRRVGRPLSRGGAWLRFSEPARRAGRPFARPSGLSHRGKEGQGEPHHRTRETQKTAIWRPRPGDPLTMSHFKATRTAFDDAWGGPFPERGAYRGGRPFTRLACNNAGGPT